MMRKHFNLIARYLKDSRPQDGEILALTQWEADCRAMADVCRQFNPNFDRERFLIACLLGD